MHSPTGTPVLRASHRKRLVSPFYLGKDKMFKIFLSKLTCKSRDVEENALFALQLYIFVALPWLILSMPRPPGLFWSGLFVLKRDDQGRPATGRCGRQDCPMVKWKESRRMRQGCGSTMSGMRRLTSPPLRLPPPPPRQPLPLPALESRPLWRRMPPSPQRKN